MCLPGFISQETSIAVCQVFQAFHIHPPENHPLPGKARFISRFHQTIHIITMIIKNNGCGWGGGEGWGEKAHNCNWITIKNLKKNNGNVIKIAASIRWVKQCIKCFSGYLSQPSPLSSQGGSVIIPWKEGETEAVRGWALRPTSQLGEGMAGSRSHSPKENISGPLCPFRRSPTKLRDYGNQRVMENGKTLTKISVKNLLWPLAMSPQNL